MPQSIQLWLPKVLTLLQWACGLGIAYVIANTILIVVGGGANSVLPVQSPTALTAESRALPPAPTLAALTKRNLFGNTNAANQTRSSAPAVPTRLPLTLEAVFVSSAAEESSAIISERGKRGKLYGPEICCLAMRDCTAWRRHKLFWSAQVHGRHLPLSRNSKRKPIIPHSLPSQRQIRRLPGTPAPLLHQLGTELKILIKRWKIGGQSEQWRRLSNQRCRRQPLLTQSGLQPGDVVLSINGRSLGDINVDRMALTNLASSGSVSVELLRNGQTLTITTRIPETLRR